MIRIGKYPEGMTSGEVYQYIKNLEEMYPHFDGTADFTLNGEFVDAEVYFDEGKAPPDFQRIRRITGYLVGDLSRFNDAKTAEVYDRVKHDTRA